jgi:hypothetical protein
MAIPGHNPPPVARGVDTFSLGGGRRRTPTTSGATANLPLVGPTQLVGVGFAPFTINVHAGAGKVTVPFTNLPRGGGASLAQAVSQSGVATLIPSGYNLIFTVSLQEASSPGCTVTPRAVDTSGVIATTSLLGSRTFRAFQAVVTYEQTGKKTVATVTGSVTAQLLLASLPVRGSSVPAFTGGTPIEAQE